MSTFLAGLLFIPSALLHGWALSVMWGWFIVPTFRAPGLGVVPAIGLCLVAGMLFRHGDSGEKRSMLNIILTNALGTLFILGAGWVVHLFM